jgi:hypothetical protein
VNILEIWKEDKGEMFYQAVDGRHKPVPIGLWYHFAVVYEDTTASIYVNGNLTVKLLRMFEFSTINDNRESNFIGMGQEKGADYVANIAIDKIKLFNKALTHDQVRMDMNAVDGIASGIC